ncbi:MAG: extracellular solute-binding protein [Candidatus Pacebacteria bacterium]|nr:extracellular solute-binding protein [Candidatus Paceibacterota bacterium]
MVVQTFLLACMGALVLLPVPARSAAAEDEKTVLRIMGLPRASSSGVTAKIGRMRIREFTRKFPQYKLEPFHMLSIRGGMDEGPLMAIATGMPPHGIYVNFRQSSTYINHGFLAPLEELYARIHSDNPKTRQADDNNKWLADPSDEEIEAAVEFFKSNVVGPVWPVIYREAEQREGLPKGKHVWAMPTSTLANALIYRKDVFKEAGLDPERAPQDWEEFLEYSRAIKQLPNKYGFYFGRGPTVSYSVYNFMVSNGVRYLRQNEEGEWEAAFNTVDAAETIYYVLKLSKGKFTADGETYQGVAYSPMGGGEVNLKWQRGEIGMRFTYLSFDRGQSINPATTGVAPTPVAPSGKRGGELNCTMMGVFADGTPEQQLGTMRYILYSTGEEAQRMKTRMMVDHGYGRFLDPDKLEKFGYDDVLKKVPEEWVNAVRAAQKAGVPEPYGKNTQMIYERVSVPINWALNRPELLDLPKDEALKRIKEQLDIAAARVNKFMLGKLTPEEWKQRRTFGGLLLLLIVGLFVGSISWAWRAFTRAEAELGKRPPIHRFAKAYLLLFPALALVFVIKYLPLILGAPLALFDYQFAINSTFVGLDNFATVLYDIRFWRSIGRTFYYVLLVVGLGFWPPILVAVLLDEVPGTVSKYVFRTIFYLPTIVSGIIMVFLWRQLYEPSESGFLNQIIMSVNSFGPVAATLLRLLALGAWLALIWLVLASALKLKELSWAVRTAVFLFGLALLSATLFPLLEAFIGPSDLVIEAKGLDPDKVSGVMGLWNYLQGFIGQFQIEPLGWIEDPGMAMVCCVIPMVWATAGPGCIIYLAALKTVPEELIEPATIDGASVLQRLAYITLPRVKFLILIQLIGAVIGAFKGGTNFILAMTGGGPNGATRTVGMDIFERSFMQLQFSTGAAMGWVLGALVILFTSYQLRRMSRATFKTGAETSVAAK